MNNGHAVLLDPEARSKGQLRDLVLAELWSRENRQASQLAFFCHGWRSGIELGFTGKTGAECLAEGIKSCTDRATIILYACSTGQWFARELAAHLGPSFDVWSHTSRGHTTRNPQLVFSRGIQTEDVWAGLTNRQRRQLRELMTSQYRLMLGDQTPPLLSEILDREPSDTPGLS